MPSSRMSSVIVPASLGSQCTAKGVRGLPVLSASGILYPTSICSAEEGAGGLCWARLLSVLEALLRHAIRPRMCKSTEMATSMIYLSNHQYYR